MVLRLAPGAADDAAEPDRIPWEREGRSRSRRLLATVRDALVRPSALGRAIAAREGGDPVAAAWFASGLALLTVVPAAVALWAFANVVPAMNSGPGRAAAQVRSMWESAAYFAASSIAIAALSVAGLAALAAFAALALRVAGCPVRWRVAWASYAYASGALALLAAMLPCLGCAGPVAGAWWAVSVVIVLAHAARVPAWKAASAVLLPPALALLALASVVVLLALREPRGGVSPPAPAAVTPSPASAPPPSP